MNDVTVTAVKQEAPEEKHVPVNENGFEKIACYILGGVFVLLPIFFIPSVIFPFQATKTTLILLAIVIALVFFFLGRLKEGALSIPINAFIGAGLLLPVVYFISALLAKGTPWVSFLGVRFEPDTVFFILFTSLLLFLVPSIVRTKERVLAIYAGFLISFSILALFQGLRLLFGADFLSFNLFTTATSNIFGKWNDLAIFFGLTGILSLITLEGLSVHKIAKGVLFAVLAISLFFLIIIAYAPVWFILGIFALGFLIYNLFRDKIFKQTPSFHGIESGVRRVPKATLSAASIIVLAIAIIMIVGGDRIANPIADGLGINQIEARPSWRTTIGIGREVYADNFLTGIGPNSFDITWAELKPKEVNTSIFWNLEFATGIGFIPTSFVTTGLLGVLTWLLFLGLFLWSGIRMLLFRPMGDSLSTYLTLSTWLSAFYLWVFAFIYIPNAVLIAFAFFFTGLYAATLRHHADAYREKSFIFSENPRLGFITVLGLTVLIVLTAVGGYAAGVRYASAVQFQRALFTLGEGNIQEAERMVAQARDLADTDVFARFAAQLALRDVSDALNNEEGTVEERRARFQNVLTDAISNAQRARDLRPENYLNWLALGRVYQNVVPLQIEGAYDNAREAYDTALSLAPHNPLLYLASAELEVLGGNNDAARGYINDALNNKNNYTAAVFLLAQIQVNENQIPEAIRSVEAATILEPNNPVVFFQLGLLRYNQAEYAGAAQAFERAISLNADYANARYFLGLSYYQLGQIEGAITQFETVQKTNQDNQELQIILNNLRDGKAPFEGSDIPSDIEERESLPIEGE